MSLRVPGGRRRGWANRLPAGLEAMVETLVLIAVMVAIFGVALLLPFPRARGGDAAVPDPVADPGIAPGDERMWTARARGRALTSLPPHKLLPDRQPAYVAS